MKDMQIGIIARFYPISKYGIVKTYDKWYRFTFSEIQSDVKRNSVVYFDVLIDNQKSLAINIRNITSNIDLCFELLNDEKSLFNRDLVLYGNPNIYNNEIDFFLKKNETKIEAFLTDQKSYINSYIDQFSNEKFWRNFNLCVVHEFLGRGDFSDRRVDLKIISRYPKILPENNFVSKYIFTIYAQLNYKWNRRVIEFKDSYIDGFVNFSEVFHRIESYDARQGKTPEAKKKVQIAEDSLTLKKEKIIKYFKDYYSKEEHHKIMSKYLHAKMDIQDMMREDFNFEHMSNILDYRNNREEEFEENYPKEMEKKELQW